MKVRINVLTLVCAGYAALLVVFVTLVVTGNADGSALELIEAPLMALIGGSIAIAKDVLTNESE